MRAPPSPRLGDLPQMITGFSRDRAKAALWLSERYGDIVRLPKPGQLVYLVTSPAAAKHVLLDHYQNYKKSWDYALLSEMLGEGLITANGDNWLKARRTIQPLFAARVLERFTPVMARHAQRQISQWQDTAVVDIGAAMLTTALGIIGECLLSRNVEEYAQQVGADLDVCQNQVLQRSLAVIDWARWLPTPGARRFKKALARLDSVMATIIGERQQALEGDADLVSLLLAAHDPETGQGMSHGRVRDELLTMFFAGFETTAVGLTWAFHLLATHQEVQERVRAECVRVLGDRPPSYADLAQLTYTKMVVEEVLRLYPPVVIFGREALADDEVCGYRIAAGAAFAFCPYATHRRRQEWQDPERFDPERFSDSARAKQVKFQYLPFGAGPRACIGAQFALLEMQLVIATAVRSVRLARVDPEVMPQPYISYRPSQPIRLAVTPLGRSRQ